MNKKLIKLTEGDLKQIVKESVSKIINEIGDTPKGQRGLGALHARKVLRNNDLSDDTYNYAQNARGGDKYDNRGNNENPLYHDYANGYIDYLNSHPDEYMANKRKRMSESYLPFRVPSGIDFDNEPLTGPENRINRRTRK